MHSFHPVAATSIQSFMKKVTALFGCLLGLLTCGCVATAYTKTVTVTKDAAGNVTQTVETETVSQPGQGWPVKFEHLQGVQSAAKEIKTASPKQPASTP